MANLPRALGVLTLPRSSRRGNPSDDGWFHEGGHDPSPDPSPEDGFRSQGEGFGPQGEGRPYDPIFTASDARGTLLCHGHLGLARGAGVVLNRRSLPWGRFANRPYLSFHESNAAHFGNIHHARGVGINRYHDAH